MPEFWDLIKTLFAVSRLHGCTSEEVNALKQRFGQIPQAVEEFYLTAGRTKEFQDGQDKFILPEHYKNYSWLEQVDGLVLLEENQGCCEAYIKKEDLALPDPPVYVSWEDGEAALCAASASGFLMAALAYEAAFTFEYAPEDFYYVDGEDIEEFKSRLKQYPFKMQIWLCDTEITFYSNDPCNLVAALYSESIEDDGLQLVYGAVTKEAYIKLERALEGVCGPF